jgi:hypothetical protein
MNKYNDRINYLLENYTFQQLSTNDKKFVLENISKSEYEMYSKIISESRLGASESLPKLPDGIKRQLTKDFKNKFKTQKKSLLQNSFISAVLMLLGTLLGYGISQYNITKESIIQILQTPITLTDTIYINKVDTVVRVIKSKPQFIIKEILPTANKAIVNLPSNKSNNIIERIPSLDTSNLFTNIESEDSISKQLGISVRQESDLMNLLELMPTDRLE